MTHTVSDLMLGRTPESCTTGAIGADIEGRVRNRKAATPTEIEAQQGDGGRGKSESFSGNCFDVDTASGRQLREFWENVVVGPGSGLCLICGVGGLSCTCGIGVSAKDVCHGKVQCNVDMSVHPSDTSATTTNNNNDDDDDEQRQQTTHR